jgi:sulfatase modifying factor 1
MTPGTSAAWAAPIEIETVPVGNAGNLLDPLTGYGRVDNAYRIGKYEVTAGQYTAFLNAVAATDPYSLYNENMSDWSGCGITRSGSPGTYTYSVASPFVNLPVNFVSYGDALRFANWLHNGQPTGPQADGTTEDGAYSLNGATGGLELMQVNRKTSWQWALTAEDEWYKAAYYKPAVTNGYDYYNYATSSDETPGTDVDDVSGNNANGWVSGSLPVHNPPSTTVVGEFQNSDSPYGTFDQAGNVWEWTEGRNGLFDRVIRGGSFGTFGLMQRTDRFSAVSTVESSDLGFRVVQVPEPSSIALLLVGALGMLLRPKRARI